MTSTPHDVMDLSPAAAGQLRTDWAEPAMPVLRGT
jgi:S-adenosylhomocysteine hydrolase